jgi:short-subunit dehydrogenase
VTALPAILVTGASSGIGAALAEAFAGDGARLVLTGRSEAGLTATAERVRSRGGLDPLLVPLDLRTADATRVLDQALAGAGLALDVLVNNAGLGLHGEVAVSPPDVQLEIVDVNVRAATELAVWAVPKLIARGRGGILNVASVASFLPGPYMAVYFASKAYLLSFSEALAFEMRGSGVTIAALCPGPTESAFGQRAGFRNQAPLDRYGTMTAEEVAAIGHRRFRAGDRVIVSGLRNQLAAWAARFLPHALTLHVLARAQRIRGDHPPPLDRTETKT